MELHTLRNREAKALSAADDEMTGRVVDWLKRSGLEIHVCRGGIWFRPVSLKRKRWPPWKGWEAWEKERGTRGGTTWDKP